MRIRGGKKGGEAAHRRLGALIALASAAAAWARRCRDRTGLSCDG